MKTTKTIAVWFVTFMVGYLVLSLPGCLFFNPDGTHISYSQVIGDRSWFMSYGVLLGWWISTVVSKDFLENEEKKEKINNLKLNYKNEGIN